MAILDFWETKWQKSSKYDKPSNFWAENSIFLVWNQSTEISYLLIFPMWVCILSCNLYDVFFALFPEWWFQSHRLWDKCNFSLWAILLPGCINKPKRLQMRRYKQITLYAQVGIVGAQIIFQSRFTENNEWSEIDRTGSMRQRSTNLRFLIHKCIWCQRISSSVARSSIGLEFNGYWIQGRGRMGHPTKCTTIHLQEDFNANSMYIRVEKLRYTGVCRGFSRGVIA